MDKRINDLYDAYSSGRMERRDFLRKLTVFTGGTAAAMSLMSLLEDNQANAAAGSRDDPDLQTEFITYTGESGEIKAYLARPRNMEKLPAVLVIHEIMGLNAHIMDVNRRMAAEGFLALAPDALSPVGGTPDDPQKAWAMVSELDPEKTTGDFVAAARYLRTHPLSTGKVGCTGFCWGGGMTNQVAVSDPDLDAAVPYYGAQPDPEDVPGIKASLMAHYGGEDERINAGIPAFEEALKKVGTDYQIYIYEGAGHAFNNDTNPDRYNEEAAKLAWERTISFFREKLKS